MPSHHMCNKICNPYRGTPKSFEMLSKNRLNLCDLWEKKQIMNFLTLQNTLGLETVAKGCSFYWCELLVEVCGRLWPDVSRASSSFTSIIHERDAACSVSGVPLLFFRAGKRWVNFKNTITNQSYKEVLIVILLGDFSQRKKILGCQTHK